MDGPSERDGGPALVMVQGSTLSRTNDMPGPSRMMGPDGMSEMMAQCEAMMRAMEERRQR
jgi:hypothetical protein